MKMVAIWLLYCLMFGIFGALIENRYWTRKCAMTNAGERIIGPTEPLSVPSGVPDRSLITAYRTDAPSTIWDVDAESYEAPMCVLELGPHMSARFTALIDKGK